jgi:hypothetical protein
VCFGLRRSDLTRLPERGYRHERVCKEVVGHEVYDDKKKVMHVTSYLLQRSRRSLGTDNSGDSGLELSWANQAQQRNNASPRTHAAVCPTFGSRDTDATRKT